MRGKAAEKSIHKMTPDTELEFHPPSLDESAANAMRKSVGDRFRESDTSMNREIEVELQAL